MIFRTLFCGNFFCTILYTLYMHTASLRRAPFERELCNICVGAFTCIRIPVYELFRSEIFWHNALANFCASFRCGCIAYYQKRALLPLTHFLFLSFHMHLSSSSFEFLLLFPHRTHQTSITNAMNYNIPACLTFFPLSWSCMMTSKGEPGLSF